MPRSCAPSKRWNRSTTSRWRSSGRKWTPSRGCRSHDSPRRPNSHRPVMPESPLNHPTDETLCALSLGQLAETELDHVSAHLGDCPACCARIDQLATDDRLLARLQQGPAQRTDVLV